MDEMTKKEAATAWGWLLEALAGFKEVGLPLLHDLIEMAPDLPDDLERKVSERVALRTLEDLFPPRNDVLALLPSASASSSTSPSKFSFDFSERCEDVLQRIINETPECDVKTDGPGLLKWDAQAFILHKRASMPKCVLGQIKDSILDGTHPYADFLIRKSGLASNRDGCNDGVSVSGSNRRFKGSCSNARNTRVEGNDANVLPSKRVRISSDGNVAGGNCVRVNDFDDSLRIAMKINRVQNTRVEGNEANVLPSKRDRVGPDIGNLVDENHVTVNDSDDSLRNAKKMKGGASFVSQCVEHNPVSLPQREQLEDLSERDVSVIESERCVLGPNSCGLNREDIIPTSQLESPCAAEGRDDVEHCLEATTSGVVHPVETQHTVCAKDSDCNREHGSQVKVMHAVSADGSPRKTIADGATEIIDIHSESRDSDEHNNGQIDVTTKKHGFLQKHAQLEHPHSRPSKIDPARQLDWENFQQSSEIIDVLSTIHSEVPRGVVLGDYVIEYGDDETGDEFEDFHGDERNWWTSCILYQVFDNLRNSRNRRRSRVGDTRRGSRRASSDNSNSDEGSVTSVEFPEYRADEMDDEFMSTTGPSRGGSSYRSSRRRRSRFYDN